MYGDICCLFCLTCDTFFYFCGCYSIFVWTNICIFCVILCPRSRISTCGTFWPLIGVIFSRIYVDMNVISFTDMLCLIQFKYMVADGLDKVRCRTCTFVLIGRNNSEGAVFGNLYLNFLGCVCCI